MSARGVSPEQRRQRADNFKVFFAIGEAAAFCLRLFTLDTEADWPLMGRGPWFSLRKGLCRARYDSSALESALNAKLLSLAGEPILEKPSETKRSAIGSIDRRYGEPVHK
jgi:hypothetical protein